MLLNNNRGMVLLMVLAVLTLLCLLGLMFVMMANMERATARAYLDMIRTKMIAQSGIHAAMVNTRALLTEKGFDIEEMSYYGEDLITDETVTGGFEEYEDQDHDGIIQTLECPLYRAVRPSFMVNLNGDKDADGNDIFDGQDLIRVQGNKVGVSGIMPGPYNQTIGAYYSLKVEDLSGKIFINGVEDEDDRKMLEAVLGNLTHELFGKESIGQALVAHAPYANLDEIKIRLGDLLNEQEFSLLKTCVTTFAWRDKGVIKHVPLDLRLGDEFGISPLPGDDVFTWRQIRPLMIEYPSQSVYGGNKKIVGRAPVNINTAPEPVLIALLRGLSGLYLDEDADFTWYNDCHSHLIGFRYTFKPNDPQPGRKGSLGEFSFTPELTRDQAYAIARAIIENRQSETDLVKSWRGSFRSWQQFGLFCDEVLVAGRDQNIPPNFLSPQQADVLKANFNPNSNLPEFNPPYQRLFWIGKENRCGVKVQIEWKTDRYGIRRPVKETVIESGYSMEFSFFPTGYFMISSLGRLLGRDNQVLSEAEIQTAVQLFSLYRETSQKDFLEDFWSRKAPITEVICPNPDPTLQPTTDDLTLQTYPEILEYDPYQTGFCRGPDVSQSEHLQNPYVQDAHYDGYITLATVENRNLDPDFRASFNKNGLDADIAPISASKKCLCDIQGPYLNRLIAPDEASDDEQAVFKTRPGTLFPDGVYSELDNVPAYDYRPTNFDSFTVSLWVKPHFFPEAGSKCRTWFTYQVWTGHTLNGHPIAPLGIYSIPGDTEDSARNGIDRTDRWDNASFFAGGISTRSENRECGSGLVSSCLNHILHQCKHAGTLDDPAHPSHETCGGKVTDLDLQEWGTLFRAGKWLHLGWVHEVPHLDRLYINGRSVSSHQRYCVDHCGGDSPESFADLQPFLRLGERRNQFGVTEDAVRLNSAPDGTIDEVLIWDGTTIDQAVKAVWEQGRYYRGDEGFFTSRAINLAQQMNLPTGTPMTIFMVNWTQYVPYKLTPYEGAGVVDLQAKGATCEIGLADENRIEIPLRGGTLTDSAGSLVKDFYTGKPFVTTEPIRYRVLFKPNLPEPVMNSILVDPLIFDDITIIYYSVPKFLSWAYRR